MSAVRSQGHRKRLSIRRVLYEEVDIRSRFVVRRPSPVDEAVKSRSDLALNFRDCVFNRIGGGLALGFNRVKVDLYGRVTHRNVRRFPSKPTVCSKLLVTISEPSEAKGWDIVVAAFPG